jgi:hypothetical protein
MAFYRGPLILRPFICGVDHKPPADRLLVLSVPPSHTAQDITVTAKMIHELWAARKFDSHVAKDMILESRCQGGQRLHQSIDWHLTEEMTRHTNRLLRVLRPMMEAMLSEFFGAPESDTWLAQFEHEYLKARFRFKCLLFRGDTESGKSKKAASLFGTENTLTVNAQGMAPALPAFGPLTGSTIGPFCGTRSSPLRYCTTRSCFKVAWNPSHCSYLVVCAVHTRSSGQKLSIFSV